MTQEEAADILEYINDDAHIVYSLNSKQILITYQHQSAVITSRVSQELEAILQTLRARKIGSLRIIQARLLENKLLKEIPTDQARRWRSRPDRGTG